MDEIRGEAGETLDEFLENLAKWKEKKKDHILNLINEVQEEKKKVQTIRNKTFLRKPTEPELKLQLDIAAEV